jgi:iron transport multicopper oxidase
MKNSATINNLTFVGQKVPALYTALSAPKNVVTNPIIYGQINPFVLKFGDVVEIVLQNADGGHHPWQ